MVANRFQGSDLRSVAIAATLVLASMGLLVISTQTGTPHEAPAGVPAARAVAATAPSPARSSPPTSASPAASSPGSNGTATVGNGNDWVGIDPSGTLASDTLTFALSGFASETTTCPTNVPAFPCSGWFSSTESNAYSLQINTNTFSCNNAFTGGVAATCWEQFVYLNCPNISCLDDAGSTGYGDQENVFIEYQLLGYLNTHSGCPSEGIPNGQGWNHNGEDCIADTTHQTATGEPPSNLGNLVLTASVGGGVQTVSLLDTSTGQSWSTSEADIMDLAPSWTQAEANVVGWVDGARANFSAGTSITVTSTFAPASGQASFVPSCILGGTSDPAGTTGETTNLTLGPCSTFTDGLSFVEANGAPLPTSVSSQVIDASTDLPWSGLETNGIVAFDQADVATGPDVTALGSDTLTYDFWTNSDCSGPASTAYGYPDVLAVSSGVALPGIVEPFPSTAVGPLGPGEYSFMASFSGDPSNDPSSSPCEPFGVLPLVLANGVSGSTTTVSSGYTVVSLLQPGGMVGQVIFPPGTTYPDGDVTIDYSSSTTGGVTNTIIDVSGANVPDPPGKSILIVSSGNQDVCIVDAPSGVTLSNPPSCTSTDTAQYQVLLPCPGQATSLLAGGAPYTCTPVTIGTTSFFNVSGLADSFVETLTKGSPTIASSVTPEGLVLGGSATDLATLTGGYAPSGTVNYTAFSDAGCTVPVFSSAEPVGVASAPFTPPALGLYEWVANYSGNVNNYAVATACDVEPLGVFDFTVSLSPAAGALTQGGSTTMTVSVGLVPGSATLALPPVALSLAGLPAGVVALGFPTSLAIGSSQTFTLETSTDLGYVSCPQVSGPWSQDLRHADLAHCQLAGASLRHDDLEGANLSGADLASANLEGADLRGADLAGADTAGANFFGADLVGTNLSGVGALGTFSLTVTGTTEGASRVGISSLSVLGDQLSGDDLQLANLAGANLTDDALVGASLQFSNLQGATATNANLTAAGLQWSNLGALAAPGASFVSANLTGDNGAGADLGGADLASAEISWSNLPFADLAGANLAHADLRWSNFAWADLEGANLAYADARWASFRDANLKNADLTDADLKYANLTGANLTGANTTGTIFAPAGDGAASSIRTVLGGFASSDLGVAVGSGLAALGVALAWAYRRAPRPPRKPSSVRPGPTPLPGARLQVPSRRTSLPVPSRPLRPPYVASAARRGYPARSRRQPTSPVSRSPAPAMVWLLAPLGRVNLNDPYLRSNDRPGAIPRTASEAPTDVK